MSPKSSAKLALGALASASTASGAIVVFDIDPDITASDIQPFNGIGVDSINLSNGTYASNTFLQGASFNVGTGYSGVIFKPGYFYNTQVSAYYTPGPESGFYSLHLFQVGQSIYSGGPFPFVTPDPSISTYSNSFGGLGSGTRYVGLSHSKDGSTYYGWLEVEVSARIGGVRNYTFTRFAFNDVPNESILAGQTTAVPEASTLGLVGGLFGLVAAAHVRRRKTKQAAASDKFLALAAGEKLN